MSEEARLLAPCPLSASSLQRLHMLAAVMRLKCLLACLVAQTPSCPCLRMDFLHPIVFSLQASKQSNSFSNTLMPYQTLPFPFWEMDVLSRKGKSPCQASKHKQKARAVRKPFSCFLLLLSLLPQEEFSSHFTLACL